MTIKEKIRDIIGYLYLKSNVTNCTQEDADQATQAILALIKPMSGERLVEIMSKVSDNWVLSEGDFDLWELADAILAEWEKGLK